MHLWQSKRAETEVGATEEQTWLFFNHQDDNWDPASYVQELHVKKYILLWRQYHHLSPHLW